MFRPTITVVTALLEDDKGCFLLAQRPDHKSMAFLWEFPGGKLEMGESPQEALVRELSEELDIQVSQLACEPFTSLTFPYPDFQLIMLVYLCTEWTGVPRSKEGQGGIEWVAPQDLHHYPMPEADKPLVVLLQRRRLKTGSPDPVTR